MKLGEPHSKSNPTINEVPGIATETLVSSQTCSPFGHGILTLNVVPLLLYQQTLK